MESLTRHHNMYEDFGILTMHEMADEIRTEITHTSGAQYQLLEYCVPSIRPRGAQFPRDFSGLWTEGHPIRAPTIARRIPLLSELLYPQSMPDC